MSLLAVIHLLNGLLMIAMPIGLAIYLTKRLGIGWRLWWIGAATFVASQVGHIPFNLIVDRLFDNGTLPLPPQEYRLLFSALFLGLSSGVWEESFRYIMYRWWAKDARWWGKGVVAGAGHGGIEAILLGMLVLITYVNMLILRNADLATMIPAEQLALAQQQVQAYWSIDWYIALLGAVERFFTIPFHIALSVLVLQVFVRKQWFWLWLAIGLHAALNGVVVYTAGLGWNVVAIEGLVGFAWLLGLAIIFGLRQPAPQPDAETDPVMAEAQPVKISPVEITKDSLDNSRYQ